MLAASFFLSAASLFSRRTSSVSPPPRLVWGRRKRWMAVFSEFVPEGSSLPWYNLKEGLCVSVYDNPDLIYDMNEPRKTCRITSFDACLSRWETHFPEVFWSRRRNIQKSVSGTCRQLLLFFLLREMSVILLKKMYFFNIPQENESVNLLCDKTLTISHSLQVAPFSFLLSSFLRITATCANVGRLNKKHRIREFQTLTMTEKKPEWSVSYWALFPFLWLIEVSWRSSNMRDSNTDVNISHTCATVIF